MGDTGDDFKAFNEMKQYERARREPQRVKYAKYCLTGLCDFRQDGDVIVIEIGCGRIDFWPYTGWYCGRKPLLGKIKGRGIKNLVREVKEVLSNETSTRK